MAVHTDTKDLMTYKSNQYPNIPGGEANYITKELQRISNTLNKLVAVVKLLEDRMNTNGLT
jgi:hypothetical protein